MTTHNRTTGTQTTPGAAIAPTRAAVYLRVSTEDQRERQTILTQRATAASFCIANDIQIADYYADDGISGTVPLRERPAGRRLLDDARNGIFDTVLVSRVDRLGRDPLHILNACHDLDAYSVQIRSISEPFDLTNPAGRFMFTILGGVAGLERDTIIERSTAATNRLAREGQWLGGIVPFGYRVEGKKREACLVVSEAPIPGMDLSEAEVVRMMYRMVAGRQSCQKVADHLNNLGIPPVYTRDGREPVRGKRKAATSGIWRAGRIRNLITNTTYKGVHQYGKRSKKQRDLIEREVPAIVSPELWEAARQALRANMLSASRNTRRPYLLRGFVKCDCCGLSYVGTSYPEYKGTRKTYYVCTGKSQSRGLYGKYGKKCPSKAISGGIEDQVWADIDRFLHHPGDVLDQLSAQLSASTGAADQQHAEVAEFERALTGKAAERDKVIGLFRRGRIDSSSLDRQLDDIQHEEDDLRAKIERLTTRARAEGEAQDKLRSAEDLLRELRARIEEPPTWALKRQLVETLVKEIRVATVEEGGQKRATATVTYLFSPTTTRTDAPAVTRATASAPAPAPTSKSAATRSGSAARCSTG